MSSDLQEAVVEVWEVLGGAEGVDKADNSLINPLRLQLLHITLVMNYAEAQAPLQMLVWRQVLNATRWFKRVVGLHALSPSLEE